jgi:toxin-antitoxin system PIN domain toxin
VTALLDGNVLIALTVEDHVHHQPAEDWMAAQPDRLFATTPITQGTLLRLLIRNGIAADDAIELLEATTVHPNHRFWTDDVPYDSAVVSGVIGHRQVTDAYLAAQARLRTGRLATFDAGLAAAHPDVVELIPTS